ncbi:hypothetical protein DID88_007674 [Monilinia fructigena]|uniref:Uncharacterized protein n=1 Tax=Monilinia fructigena TaxID=38457 RepID=A0A395J344_9HELO|nr:hypothetical protein DID88_007674 [Monilinia fructigena]
MNADARTALDFTPPVSPNNFSLPEGDGRNGGESGSAEASAPTSAEIGGGVGLVESSRSNADIDADTDTDTPHSHTNTTALPSPITVIYSPLTRGSHQVSDDEQTEFSKISSSQKDNTQTDSSKTFRRRVEPHIKEIVEGRDSQDWAWECVSETSENEVHGSRNENRSASWHIEDVDVEREEKKKEMRERRECASDGGKKMSFWKGKGKERGNSMVCERSGSGSSNLPTNVGTFNEGFLWQPRQMMSGKGKGKASERQRSKSDGELLSNRKEERGNEDEKRRRTWANLGRMPNFRKAPVVEAPTNGEEKPTVESESHQFEREQERERRNMDRKTSWSDADLDGHKDKTADQDTKERASKFCIFTRALSSKKNQ